MKATIVSSICVLLAIAFICGYSIKIMHEATEPMLHINKSLQQKLIDREWEELSPLVDQLEEVWKTYQGRLEMLTMHHDTQNIKQTLLSIRAYLDSKDAKEDVSELLAILRMLDETIQHLEYNEVVSLQSLF